MWSNTSNQVPHRYNFSNYASALAYSAQHMADNALALLLHLSSPSSPIPSLIPHHKESPRLVFFAILGRFFFLYSFTTASILSGALLVVSAFLAHLAAKQLNAKIFLKGTYAIVSAVVGSVLGANTVAFLMDKVLGRPLSWFSSEVASIFLFAPPAIAGSSSHANLPASSH
jgi:hypothetical protein